MVSDQQDPGTAMNPGAWTAAVLPLVECRAHAQGLPRGAFQRALPVYQPPLTTGVATREEAARRMCVAVCLLVEPAAVCDRPLSEHGFGRCLVHQEVMEDVEGTTVHGCLAREEASAMAVSDVLVSSGNPQMSASRYCALNEHEMRSLLVVGDTVNEMDASLVQHQFYCRVPNGTSYQSEATLHYFLVHLIPDNYSCGSPVCVHASPGCDCFLGWSDESYGSRIPSGVGQLPQFDDALKCLCCDFLGYLKFGLQHASHVLGSSQHDGGHYAQQVRFSSPMKNDTCVPTPVSPVAFPSLPSQEFCWCPDDLKPRAIYDHGALNRLCQDQGYQKVSVHLELQQW